MPAQNQIRQQVTTQIVESLTRGDLWWRRPWKSLGQGRHRNIISEQCISVVDFIEESVGARQLSMRIYETSLRKVEYAIANSIDWQDLVLSQLNQIGKGVLESSAKQSPRELDLATMKTAIEAHPENVRLQQDLWCDHRGKSRASFEQRRCMKRLPKVTNNVNRKTPLETAVFVGLQR